ncbi:fatty acid-binding protein, liver-like [Glandiceps talaboti]
MTGVGKFAGKWEFVRHENSEALFAEMGVPEEAAKMLIAAKPHLEIFEEDGCWVLKETNHAAAAHFEKFKLDEPTEITTLFGKREIIASLEDGKLVTRGNKPGDDLVAVRQVDGDQLVVKVTKNTATGVCFFKKA